MFDWIKKVLFEEEVVEVEEKKLEEINFSQVKDIEEIITETPKKEPIKEVLPKEEIKAEEVKVEEPQKPILNKKEFNIQLTEPKEPQTKTEIKQELRRRIDRNTEPKEQTIEIGSVISPIFGGGEVKKNEQKTTVTVTPKRKDEIGIVISPMYGQKELSEHEKQAKAKIEENKKKNVPIIEEDDWKNDIPLDELITKEEETNDCVQFSLFGDNQAINE